MYCMLQASYTGLTHHRFLSEFRLAFRDGIPVLFGHRSEETYKVDSRFLYALLQSHSSHQIFGICQRQKGEESLCDFRTLWDAMLAFQQLVNNQATFEMLLRIFRDACNALQSLS